MHVQAQGAGHSHPGGRPDAAQHACRVRRHPQAALWPPGAPPELTLLASAGAAPTGNADAAKRGSSWLEALEASPAGWPQEQEGTGAAVEAVIIPVEGGRPGGRPRTTLCVSSQVGCAQNCQFCLTGRMGLRGNLATAQIVEQVRLWAPAWLEGCQLWEALTEN